MSDAELLIEAIDTATRLYEALVQWLIVLAVTGSILVIAAVACGAWGIRTVMERLDGPSWRRGRIRAWWLARRRRDYDTAA